MDRNMTEKHVKWYISFALGALMGGLVFVMLYGVRILDVTYDDWLLTGWYDLSQHYVGWKLYRASGWHFPIGLCDNSFYPYMASVIYTDSIPLVCLFFKILSPILPKTFQFFGIYGLFCFMMQGGTAKLILRRVLPGELLSNLACIPFIFCAPLWQRMYFHTALASHYLILMAILLYLYRDRIGNSYKRMCLWAGLGILCVTIHFTIYGMVSVMLVGFALWEALDAAKDKDHVSMLKPAAVFLSYILTYLASTVFVFLLFGGFYGNVSSDAEGLGDFSANLNSLFNPIDYSRIIREFPLGGGQYEGLSYVGITALILTIPAAAYIIRNIKKIWQAHKSLIISVIFTSIVLWVIALSPKVTFGQHVLYEIPLPKSIYNAWSMFRASGRFLWPVMYVYILVAVCYSRFEIKGYFTAVLLAGCLLQFYEFSGKVSSIEDGYREVKTAYFDADSLDSFSWPGIKHLQFMHDYYFGEFYGDEIRNQMIGYTEFALRHGMTVSNFHFSRDDMDGVRRYIAECEKKLEEGTPDPDTIYVYRKEDVSLKQLEERFRGVTYLLTEKDIIAIPTD